MLRGRADARIVAVVEPVAERVEEAVREFGCRVGESLADVLAMGDVDVVVLATPSKGHAGEAIAAMRAGKHVVVEKPMAMGVDEADRMIETSRGTGRRLFINQSYRYSPELLHLKGIVASGVIGTVFHVRHNTAGFWRRNDWQTLSKHGGGLLSNTGAHFVDCTLQLLPGRVTEVMGDLKRIASAGDTEDHVKALIRSDTGATADVEISMAENAGAGLPKWVICGTTGTVTSDGAVSTVRYFDPAEAPPLEAVDGAAPDRKYGTRDVLPWREKVVRADECAGVEVYANVYGALRNGEEIFVTPESVREGIRTMGMIRESAGRVARGSGLYQE
jgi:predicted dehydrogenase